MENIKQVALELFAVHGADRVSMDEIAEKAGVSKVTIYKYFGSKEDLYAEAINLFVDEALAATEQVLNSDMDFLAKLKTVLTMQTSSFQWVNADYLYQLWELDSRTAGISEGVRSRVKALMFRFYEEGVQQGYIEPDTSFDLLFLYADVFRAGLKARMVDREAALVDKQALEQLYDLYFFGFIKRE